MSAPSVIRDAASMSWYVWHDDGVMATSILIS